MCPSIHTSQGRWNILVNQAQIIASPSIWEIETTSPELVRLREKLVPSDGSFQKTGKWMLGQKVKQMSTPETQVQLPLQGASARRALLPAPTFLVCFPTGLCSARSLLCYPELSTALIYHLVQQFAFAVFSKERDSCCNLASSPKLKGSSYRISEVPPPSELWGSGFI